VVSVCIRAYERPEELQQAIASVLGQTYRGDFEVVVADDFGRLREVVERVGDPRVRYVPNPTPSGPAGNLRHAAAHARGDVLALLNDDDWWEPGFLSACMGVLEADPGVDVVFTEDSFWVGGRRVANPFTFRPGRHDRFVREVLDRGPPASGTVVRRSAFPAVPDGVVGDGYVFLWAASRGHAFHFIPSSLSVTRIHAGQGSWSEEGLPTRMIATLSPFRFDDDPGAEQLRRSRLAEQYLIRAGRRLRRRRWLEGMGDLRQAREVGGSLTAPRAALALSGLRGFVMRTAPPRVLALVLERWPRLRPAVARTPSRG
jgi:glycosyltransferase involved in cell wall biosynthesis